MGRPMAGAGRPLTEVETMLRISSAARAALPALAATAMLAGLATSAEAGGPYHRHHGYSGGAGLVTGLAVGALVGTALAAPYAYPPPPPMVYGPPAYAYVPPPPPQPYCYQADERFWVPGYGWQYRPVTVCE